jgi:hypothetical protein
MDFVKQTKFMDEGNCLEACIASLTGLPLDEFPDLSGVECDDGKFWGILNEHLRSKLNVYVESIKFGDYNSHYERGIIIAVGDTARSSDIKHAVLWDFEKGRMVFDPSPDGGGLVGIPSSFCILVNYYRPAQ